MTEDSRSLSPRNALSFITWVEGIRYVTLVTEQTRIKYSFEQSGGVKDIIFVRAKHTNDYKYLGYMLASSPENGVMAGVLGTPERHAFKVLNWYLQTAATDPMEANRYKFLPVQG